MERNLTNFRPTEQANFFGIGLTILVLVLLALFIDMNSVREWVLRAGMWAPIVFIFLKISTVVIAPLSGSPLYPLVGLIFGFWPGILYVAIGDFLGYTISFYISRIFGQKIVNKFLSGKEESLVARIVDHIGDTRGFFQAYLAFFALPEVLSYAAGLSRISYLKFISILSPLSVLVATVLVFFGSILELRNESLLIGLVVPIVGAIVILTGGTLFLKAIKNKSKSDF